MYLNSFKDVILPKDLEGVSEDKIQENLSSRGVLCVKRIQIRWDNKLVPMNTFICTFNTPSLPESINAVYLVIPIVMFVPNHLRCFNCEKFGHG